ncbi:hypothetical protein F5Y08DRAFT_116476 [Xylaria arbuscula]|nr:hypothetical protein F5Y08DRAFT_116476 [Xylaria arbuscula]
MLQTIFYSSLSRRAEEPKTEMQNRSRRTRSGCQRCRAQRRKCDERKPGCERCAKANATCKYVTHVSFKTKNSRTSSNDLGPTHNTASNSGTTYPTIEFIIDDGKSRTQTSNPSTGLLDEKDFDNHGPSPSTIQSSTSLGTADGWPLVGPSILSIDEIELLKYYKHHVAPWLDVYDERQTFNLHVPKLAMTSPCILELLLQVSAVFSNRPIETVTRRGAGLFHLQAMSNPSNTESPSAALRSISCFVLARTLLFVDEVPDTWKPSFEGGGAFHYFRKFTFSDRIERQIWFSFLTLILRLEIAYCLINRQAPAWIPELAGQLQTQLNTENVDEKAPQRCLHAALRVLKLLIDVMQSSFTCPQATHHSATPTVTDSARINKERTLARGLAEWYNSRPSDLEPLVDVANPEAAFPAVVFTNGAGIASNMLYHTAMFLLLDRPPRVESSQEASTERDIETIAQDSSQWHAHRICAIATNSDPEYTRCWDPLTIAAFFLAAQKMRYSSEKNEILKCLSQLKEAGWRVEGLERRLRDEWNTV